MKRSGSVANGALLVVLVIGLAAIALIADAPSPPSVAEFAPQSIDQILEAPNSQSSQFGDGTAPCPPGVECLVDADGQPLRAQTPRPRTIERARVRRCVGDPPRQTEDLQSPPCAPYFDGDNGGATAKGVTRDEILVAWPKRDGYVDPRVMQAWADHFNSRFEFYGRQIKMVRLEQFSSDANAVERYRADARTVAEFGAFASLPYGSSGAIVSRNLDAYYDALAELKVVSVNGDSVYKSAEGLSATPYRWNFTPAIDEVTGWAGEMYCAQLANRPANHAGPLVQGVKRKVAIAFDESASRVRSNPEIVRAKVATCDDNKPLLVDLGQSPDDARLQQAIAQMRQENVTTVYCVCGGSHASMAKSADQAGWFPEWLLTPFSSYADSTDYNYSQYPDSQKGHVFGLHVDAKYLPDADQDWYKAAKDVDPTYEPLRPAGIAAYKYLYPSAYKAMLLLASGIQQAGPNLTPDSFARGLERTKFPNPGCAGPPAWQACVGFGVGDHTMVNDAALVWFSETAPTHLNPAPVGSFCFVERGNRWSRNFPSSDHFFDAQAPCR